MKKPLLSLFTCALLISSASADPVTFIFRAEFQSSALDQGYTAGANYYFTFTTGASYPTLSTLSASIFDSHNYWKNFSSTDSALFVSASGTGLSGTFVPSATNPHSYIFLNGLGGGSDFVVGSESETVGMSTLFGTPISYFEASGVALTLSPAGGFTGAYVDPTAYFAARPGVYDLTASTPLRLYGSGGGANLLASFSLNQLTINAVPEPATYGAIAGIAMLSLAFWRRRRKTHTGA